MIQVVIKAEKYHDLELPKKQILSIIESAPQEKIKTAILDVLQVILDPGLGKHIFRCNFQMLGSF